MIPTLEKERPEFEKLDAGTHPSSGSLQTTVQQSPVTPAPRRASAYEEEYTFSYRPVPVIAVVGLVLALLSSVATFIWLALPLCVVGLVVSTLAFCVIRRNKDVFSGTLVALSGMFLSAAFLTGGISYQVYTYKTEVPDGYERKSFVKDISDKGFIVENGMSTIHPDVYALEGQEIFLKGFIYQTGKLKGLQSFLLVKDNQSCCFGGNPAITDRIGVVMPEGAAIDFKAGRVGVGGTFRINPHFANQDKEPLYMLDGVYFTSRVSDF